MFCVKSFLDRYAMQYFGGKSRIAKQIGDYLNSIRKKDQIYYEPFVGGGSIIAKINDGPCYASDVNKYVITMWKALQDGWKPPTNISKEKFDRAKNQVLTGKGNMSDELLGFIGCACTYSGIWYSGYARNNRGDNYANQSRNGLLKKFETIPKNTTFTTQSYQTLKPKKNSLIYCDPPYKNTTNGYLKNEFNVLNVYQTRLTDPSLPRRDGFISGNHIFIKIFDLTHDR